jgi:Family of unknown function (DUF6114)
MAPSGTKSYPSTAFVLSLIGGIFILLGGLADAAIYALVGGAVFALLPGLGVLFLVLAVVGLLIGLLTIVGAVMLRSKPESAHTWGILIIVFSVISLVTGGGGFIIGFILALIGGILALTWKPPQPAQAAWGQQPMAPPAAPPMSPPPS